MVAPFTDLRDGDAENLINLVLSGFIIGPTLLASLLISAHIASRAGRQAPCNYQNITGISTDLFQSLQNRIALLQAFQCFVKNEAEQCCRKTISLPNSSTYDKRVTYFPIHYYFALGSFKCHFHEPFYLSGYPKTR